MSETVTISTNEYTVYESVAFISAYLAADPGRSARWAAFTTDQKSQGAVASTRYIDRQSWAGSKADADQDLAWPRTGVTYPDGTAVASDTVPQQVLDAFCLLACDLVAKPADADKLSTANNNKRVKAGSAEVEKFRPEAGTPLLTAAQALLGQFLGGSAAASDIGAGYAGGTCQQSRFCGDYEFTRGV
jgi:hypothetical protein